MTDGNSEGDKVSSGPFDFVLVLVGTLAGLAVVYILYLMVAAAIRGDQGDMAPVLLGLALWGGVSALAWIGRSQLRARKRANRDDRSL